MANRYAVASGNWSNLATWDGGVSLPGASDTVRPNGYTVTIDQDITVAELRHDASAPAAAGGSFQVTSGGRTLTTDIYKGTFEAASGSVSVLILSHSSGTVTLNVPSTGKCTGLGGVPIISKTGTGDVVYNGDINIITAGGGYETYYFATTNTGTITFTGSWSSISGYHTILKIGAAATVNIVGNLVVNGSYGYYVVFTASGATLNITGNVTAGIVAPTPAINIRASSTTINITGNVVGGAGTVFGMDSYVSTYTATITIVGNVTGGSGQVFNASSAAWTIIITGNVTAGAGKPVFTNYDWHTGMSITLNGNMIANANGVHPFGTKLFVHPTQQLAATYQVAAGGASRTLYTPGVPTGHSDPSDTRYGTVYGPANELTGTLRVPPAGSVALGVLVDAGVGTMDLSVDTTALDAAVASLEAAVASLGIIQGSGADLCTLRIRETDLTPVADADVWITTDSAGTNVVAGTLQTDSSGEVTFLLDAGNSYYLWAQKDGWEGIQGTAFTAVAD